MQGQTKTIKTKSTYEAAYYIMYGGVFSKLRQVKLCDRESGKKGYLYQWILTIDNVPVNIIETWRTRCAFGNITNFIDARIKLKKAIKRAIRDSN